MSRLIDINIMSNDIMIKGAWDYHGYYTYKYSWNASDFDDLSSFSIPAGATVSAGSLINVNTTYKKDMIIDIGNYTSNNVPSGSIRRIAYGNNIYVALGGSSLFYSTTGETNSWASVEISNQTKDYVEIAFCNGKFVITLSNDSLNDKYFYSTDGITWTEGSFPSKSYWTGLKVLNNLFIINYTGYNATFYYSSDGITWTEGSFPYYSVTCEYIYSNNTYWYFSKNRVYKSTDLITWSDPISYCEQATHVYTPAYGNSRYIVCGDDRGYYSTDGITWNKINFPYFHQTSFYYCNNKFFGFSNGVNPQIIISNDGINWRILKAPSNFNARRVIYNSGTYFITGSNSTSMPTTVYYTVTDDDLNLNEYYKFSGWNPSENFNIMKDTTISGTWEKKNKLKVTYNWTNLPSNTLDKPIDQNLYIENELVTIDTSYTSESIYDNLSYDISYIGIDCKMIDAFIYAAGKFVIVPQYSKLAYYSTDGITWNSTTFSSVDTVHVASIAYGNGLFICSALSSKTLYISPDGITWTSILINVTDEINPRKIQFGNGYFVIEDYTHNQVLVSQDGYEWSLVKFTLDTEVKIWNNMDYVNGTWLAVGGQDGALYCAHSTDPTNSWEAQFVATAEETGYSGKTIYPSYIVYGAGKYIISGHNTRFGNNRYWYSTDCLNWTMATLPVVEKSALVYMHYYCGYFIGCMQNSDENTDDSNDYTYSTIIYSTDGLNWKTIKIDILYTWGHIVYHDNYCYCISNMNISESSKVYICKIKMNNKYFKFSGWDKSNFNITEDTTINGNWATTNKLLMSYNWTGTDILNVNLPDSQSVLPNSFITINDTYKKDDVIEQNWVLGTLPISASWDAAAYGNGKFVAISGRTNYCYSSDGINWTAGAFTNDPWLLDIVYGKDKFVIIGDDNFYAYSSDGSNWTTGTLPENLWDAYRIYYTNGIYVIACSYQHASNYLGYSYDGINWNVITLTESSTYRRGAAGNGIFIIFYDNNYIRSTDGINWETYTKLADTWYNCIGFDNGYFIALSSSKIAYSTDGINWTITDNRTNSWYESICCGNNMCLGITRWGSQSSTYIYSKSINIHGPDFSIHSLPNIHYWSSACYGNGKFLVFSGWTDTDSAFAYLDVTNYYQFSGWSHSNFNITSDTTITGSWSKKNKLSVTYSWTGADDLDVKLPDKEYYKSGDNVTIKHDYGIQKVTKFEEWTSGELPSSQKWQSVCYGNGKFVVISGSTTTDGYSLCSTDGINWTSGNMPNRYCWQSVCYGNGKFVAVSGVTNAKSNVLAYSTDGITWTKGTMPSSQYWKSVCYGKDKFVAVSVSTSFAYSTDGINWTSGTLSLNSGWEMVEYCNDKFIAIGNSTTNTFAYSTDGITWTQGSMPSSQNWTSVCYGNGKYVAATYDLNSDTGIMAYSSNGINWTETIKPDGKIGMYVCYGNGKFIATDYYGTYVYSTDGITWEKKSMPANLTYNRPCYGNNKFIAVAYESSAFAYAGDVDIYYKFSGWNKSDFNITSDISITGSWNLYIGTWIETTLPSAQSWSDICYGNGKFVTIGSTLSDNSNTCAYSTDGITWKQSTLPVTQTWQSVCYGKDKFIAIGQSSKFAYSIDAITWTQGTITARAWYKVCYGNGRFVAITNGNGNVFAYSSDGIDWTESALPIELSVGILCYGNGRFVTIHGWDSNLFAHSSDGINWTQGTMPSSQRWSSVCYGNDKFVAVAQWSSTFAYSSDGINWKSFVFPSYQRWRSVSYGNGIYIVLVFDSNIFAYSTDGINWTQGNMSSKQAWSSVCYGNGKFVINTTDTNSSSNLSAYLNLAIE